MIEMANKPRLTKVSRVFLRIYTYTARVGEGCRYACGGVPDAWELES
jgi:hypothetical protein